LTGFGVRGSAFGVEGRCIAARARPLTALALAALLGLLAACSSSPYHNPPRYTLPKDFNAAARQLIGAVAFGGVGYQDVGGNELVLRWREQLSVTDKQRLWVDRELDLRTLQSISEPAKPGEHWQVRVATPGGVVTFIFKDARSAAQAASALMRLGQWTPDLTRQG
jgi:hypothetical protein